jgi:hypothetical protein
MSESFFKAWLDFEGKRTCVVGAHLPWDRSARVGEGRTSPKIVAHVCGRGAPPHEIVLHLPKFFSPTPPQHFHHNSALTSKNTVYGVIRLLTSLYFVIGNPNFASSWFRYFVIRLVKSLNLLSTAVAHCVISSLWKHDCLYSSSASWSKHLTFSLISWNVQNTVCKELVKYIRDYTINTINFKDNGNRNFYCFIWKNV